jgi:hypothetical protein
MKKLLVYTLIWVAENLSIPFWIVGHVHLSTNVYKDIHELIASVGMNIVVAIGFWLGYKKSQEK